jgi:diacylglycerol kinase (ATP)
MSLVHQDLGLSQNQDLCDPPHGHPFARDHTVVIYNPISGTVITKPRGRRLVQLLRQRGYHVADISAEGQAAVLAEEAANKGFQSLIVIGGDGTLNDVVCRLPHQMNIGYFPGGSVNLFALNLGIPFQPEPWLQLLEAGTVRPVRLGLCNGHPFASLASVGFDALVVAKTSPPLKRLLSGGGYAVQFIPSYFTYDAPRYAVTVDDRQWDNDVLGVVVSRGPHYGGPFRALPPCDPVCSELSYAILGGRSKWLIGKFAVGMLFETLSKMSDVACGSAQAITVSTDPPSYVQLDGNHGGTTPVTFAVEAADRRILAPAA